MFSYISISWYVCNVVNKGDNSRVDLILPNEQYLYLKASDYKERQKWLVALASQKAIYPMNSMPQVISGSSASSSAAAANDSESSGGAEHKLPNMSEFLPILVN